MARDIKFVIPASFLRGARRVLSAEHIETLKTKLALNPELGDLIPRTGGARKVRQFGATGQSRVIYYFHAGDGEVFLLTCYPKNDKKDLSEAEKRELHDTIKMIKDAKSVAGR